MRLTALASVLVLAACGSDVTVVEHVEDGPVMAAVVRGDGFIVPFAVYEDGGWWGPDTEPYPDLADRPSAWFADRLDMLGRWRLVTPLGLSDPRGEPVPISVTGMPVEVGTHCQRAWALPTDLPGIPTPEFTVHQNVGMALSVDSSSVRVAELAATPDETERTLRFLTPYFNAAEAQEVTRREVSGGYEPRRVGPAVATGPLGLTLLHRVGGDAGVSYYVFEASRRYGGGPDAPPGCDEATVMTGWLYEDPSGALVLLSGDVNMTNCDRKGSPRVQPMGALRLGGQLFVLTVERHYEGESYAVVRIDPASATTVLTVYGGGC